MKVQEGYVPKYLNSRIYQSPISFNVDQIDHIMELVNEWSQTENFRQSDIPFRKDSTYEKEIVAELPLTGIPLREAEM